jgi:hypothetical protein
VQPEESLLCSQEPVTCLCPELDEIWLKRFYSNVLAFFRPILISFIICFYIVWALFCTENMGSSIFVGIYVYIFN